VKLDGLFSALHELLARKELLLDDEDVVLFPKIRLPDIDNVWVVQVSEDSALYMQELFV
jgi:hypothetical protein